MSKVQQTEFTKEFKKEVLTFRKKHNMTMSMIGNNKTVNYSNISKLNDYFINDIGRITDDLIGKIKQFMSEVENK